jgi:CheY-like chemotaxis protein
VRNIPFDIVLLDVKMPGLTGYEVLNEIKVLKPDLPIIMLTGYGFQLSEQSLMQHKVFYLGKPVDIEALVKIINFVLAEVTFKNITIARTAREEGQMI